MSRISVIVALVITILLAAAALLLSSRPPPPHQGSAATKPLLDFEAAELVEIAVSRPGAPAETARRLPSGAWVVQLGDTPPNHPWPAAGERIRPAIRILSTLLPARAASETAELGRPPHDATEVRLRLADGGERLLRIAPRALAGAVLVEAVNGGEKRAAWVDAALGDMFTITGLGPWRQSAAMGELGPEVARVHIQGTNSTISLGRVQGRWAVRAGPEPVSHPAEPDAIARLFSLLGQVRVEDFLDQGAPADTGVDTPPAVLTVESDHRDPGDPSKVTTVARKLEVGRTADVAGRTVFARLSGSESTQGRTTGEWSRKVILSGEALAEIATAPTVYLARRALAAPAAEVGQIQITQAGAGTPLAFARTLDGWQRVENGGHGPLAASDGPGIAALLELLGAPAATILLRIPEEVEPLAIVELLTVGKAPLERLELGRMPDALAISNRGVCRVYTAGMAERLLQWIATLPRS